MNAVARRPVGGAALLAATGVLVSAPLAAQQVTYNGSLYYSTGSYVFTDRTHSLWLTNGLSLRAGPLNISANLPIIAQNSGIVSFVAGQPLPTGGEQSGAVQGRGRGDRIGSSAPSTTTDSTVVFRDSYEVQVGDPTMSASAEIYSGFDFLRSVAVQGSAKAPLRTLESGVGTGEWDFGAGVSLVVGSGLTLVLGDVSYWSFGDLPDLELKGSVLYSLGLSRAVMDARGSVLLTVAGASSIIDSVDPPLSAGLGFLYTLGGGRTVSTGASVGLSEASPDFSAWVGWGVGF